jgi:serine/threonine-protein kinase
LFDGNNDAEVMHRVLTCQIPSAGSLAPGLLEVYDRILARGLSRNPAERFHTAREMALELEAASTPMRASEIGDWVEGVAADVLRRRSHQISKIERSVTDDVSPVAATKPATPAPLAAAEPFNTAAKVSWANSAPRRTSSWLLLAVVAAGLGGLSALLWLTRIHQATPATPSMASFSALSKAPAPISSGLAQPSAPAQPGAAAAQSPPAGASANSAASTVDHGVPGVTSASVRRGKPKTSANCDPPYSIDASGHHIFKLECM